ncbi:MAG: DUF362 domain-containing protein [Streptosporangiales bacterium]|nr:DUF362 domain-containing protein [Streptosporangiales bacterium]
MTSDRLRLCRVRQRFSAPAVVDLIETVRKQVDQVVSGAGLAPGSRVAVTAGSRGVVRAPEIYRAVVGALRDAGHEPFLFTAMGSHGGGTADGQRALLDSLGVTAEAVGAEVVCSDDVTVLGRTVTPIAGLPVLVASEAAAADAVLVVNRVKPHTSFHGSHESGLLKMLAVGMGRARGATMVHRLGWQSMEQAIESIAAVVLDRLPVLGGLAVLENANEQPAQVEAMPAAEIAERETALLETARALMPYLPVDRLDLCVVREMGKNISGTGMDTNVIGRLRIEGLPEPPRPSIQYLAVLDLTEESHGNATGVGLADFTTQRLADRIDRAATYLNCLTSGSPIRGAVPMTLPDDRAVFDAVWQAMKPQRFADVRAAVIADTLHLGELWLSERSAAECGTDVEVLGDPTDLTFDGAGSLVLPTAQ